MSGGCNHDCASCSQKCGKESLQAECNAFSKVKNVYAVVSGKGGVGKSLVTSLLAVNMNRKGYKTAILDADITGPSIPKAFGLTERATGSERGIDPAVTKQGVKVMSVNLLLENDTDPVVWRGPVIAGTVKQFWTDVVWGDVDYMFVDMPPGTGDVPLTVFQSLPIKGIIIVTSPQDLVSMIVSKAVKMANLMDIPVLALVENYSYFECPDCKNRHYIYGESKAEEIVEEYGIPNLARIPIHKPLAEAEDKGEIESYVGDWLDGVTSAIEK
ncbi:MAG: Mrp/NBP35 family ATP-binding protein [Ruminococcaceae bacterium]|nr:Mrp/NBP35 family ATP-binding protein [Oscillospiraceae bacterium]